MERKQVFYINEIKFVCDAIENLCENNGIECYTLNSVDDFSYLIDDLKPEMIMIDSKALKQEFWEQVKNSQLEPKTMLIGECVESNLSKDFDYFHSEKIDIITFGQILKNHLN